MAVRRPAGFLVPIGFYDGPEVESMPRRIRAAAVGVWALCGAYSANKLLDGYVGPRMLKQLGCTDAIRAALMSTRGPDGELDPLWVDARDGGIQFTKWVKYQRSRDEVKAYRSTDADRKRAARDALRNSSTSDNAETSARTSPGHPPDDCDPKTKTKTKTQNSHPSGELTTVDAADAAESATPGAELVRAIIPAEHPAAVRTMLRIRASELIRAGNSKTDVGAALELWLSKPHLGPNSLASLVSEVIKARAAPGVRTSNGPTGVSHGDAKVLDWLGRNPQTTPLELQ